MELWTVLQRNRLDGRVRDLAAFFNPMNEPEARALADRLLAYDKQNRATYIPVAHLSDAN